MQVTDEERRYVVFRIMRISLIYVPSLFQDDDEEEEDDGEVLRVCNYSCASL
jgi:hypothetical protein